jgi:hypothetical protein
MKIEFEDFDHTTNVTKNCQLFVGLTGTREYIIKRLQSILDDTKSAYGKPFQGIVSEFDGTSTIKTPIWKGKEY